MKLRTDDDIYRARLVYLGPPGYTLPVQLPYAEWGLFAALAVSLTAVGVLGTGSWSAAWVALAAAVFATAYIWHHVDPDRPARKVLITAATDWQRIRPPTGRLPRYSTRHVRFSTLETGASR